MPTRTTTRVQSSRKTTTPKSTTKTTPKTTTPKTTRVQSSRKTTSISRGGKKKGGDDNSIKTILLLNDIEYQILSEIITNKLLELMMNVADDKKENVSDYLSNKKVNNCDDIVNDKGIDNNLKTIIDIDCKFVNSFTNKLMQQEKSPHEELNIEINLTHAEINTLKKLYEEGKELTLKQNKIDKLFEKIKTIKTEYDRCLIQNTKSLENISACNKDQILEDMMSNLVIEMINKRREKALSEKLNQHNGGKKTKINK